MDAQNIRQRVKDDENTDTATTEDTNMKNKPRDSRIAMAKRGMRSLAIAVTIPMSLTFLDVYFFGSSKGYGSVSAAKPFGILPLWVLHMSCLGSSLLMGLCAWLVWAEGGFHRKPTALALYLAQLGFSLAWSPIVIRLGIPWVGLMVCLALFGSLVGCSRQFKEINPVAGDLVKPCLAWAALLAIVNLKLAFI